ncbi:MAG: branched-chain amino acid ABC transporter permease [Geodermatophilaceae bacterium]|nr:branched-chain amino acid ABC transporter permease [Geodermatophilaceae bacterium]
MSDTKSVQITKDGGATTAPSGSPTAAGTPAKRGRIPRDSEARIQSVLGIALILVAIALPLYLDNAFLSMGLAVMAAAVGAIGLNLLSGVTGQLSLAHAFFIAIGTYGYAYFSGSPGGVATPYGGLELPPLLGAVMAIALAGLAGLAFSPIASRLSGIYLGVASLSLVFLGQHLLFNWESVTGGPNGRSVPTFSLFGFPFANPEPGGTQVVLLGVPLQRNELLWYLFLAVLIIGYLFARNLLRGRHGRALQMIRDKQTAAAVMGVNVRRYKSSAFVISSMYAGAAGVLLALFLRVPTPGSFGLILSVTYLAMIVIGGLGSIPGAVVGAAFVAATPLLLNLYSDFFPFLAEPGSGGVDSGTLAKFLYGGAVVVVLLLEPGGVAALGRRVLHAITGTTRRQKVRAAAPVTSPVAETGESPAESTAVESEQGPDRGTDPSTEGNRRP